MYKVLSLILIFVSQLFSQYEVPVSKIDSVLKDSFFESTIVGISAYNLTKSEPIYIKNDKLLLRPASNMKVITTAAMLYFLGPKYKFYTGIYTDGIIKDNKLYGDLYFYGNGDPSFNSNDLDTLIIALKNKNINEITGTIYGDVSAYDSKFWGEGWMWDDDPSSDFPYFTPLIINESCVDVFIESPTNKDKTEIKIFPQSSYFTLTNNLQVVDEGRNNFDISRNWMERKNNLTVNGLINKNFKGYRTKINLFNPADFFMYYAVERLKENGIKVKHDYDFKDRPQNVIEISKVESNFGDLIVKLNKESDNLYAEAALKALAYELKGKPASSKSGTRVIDSLVTIIGLNHGNYYFADGSGVSHYNLVSAELLNKLLIYFYNHHPNLYQILSHSFPIGGIDGTLRYRMKADGTLNNVSAKTGTLSGVSSLSGYLTAKKGDLISFSILIQNYIENSNMARNFQDKICEILSELN